MNKTIFDIEHEQNGTSAIMKLIGFFSIFFGFIVAIVYGADEDHGGIGVFFLIALLSAIQGLTLCALGAKLSYLKNDETTSSSFIKTFGMVSIIICFVAADIMFFILASEEEYGIGMAWFSGFALGGVLEGILIYGFGEILSLLNKVVDGIKSIKITDSNNNISSTLPEL